MKKYLEKSGKTEDEALAAALRELGLDRDDVSVEIVERAKSGFLGIGSSPAVVRVDFERGRLGVKSEEMYKRTVRCAFSGRRKTLENNLVNGFSLSRERAKAILERSGIDEKARGETLSPERFARLLRQ